VSRSYRLSPPRQRGRAARLSHTITLSPLTKSQQKCRSLQNLCRSLQHKCRSTYSTSAAACGTSSAARGARAVDSILILILILILIFLSSFSYSFVSSYTHSHTHSYTLPSAARRSLSHSHSHAQLSPPLAQGRQSSFFSMKKIRALKTRHTYGFTRVLAIGRGGGGAAADRSQLGLNVTQRFAFCLRHAEPHKHHCTHDHWHGHVTAHHLHPDLAQGGRERREHTEGGTGKDSHRRIAGKDPAKP